MKGIKIMLLSIAVILLGIAVSTMNFFGFFCGGLGDFNCYIWLLYKRSETVKLEFVPPKLSKSTHTQQYATAKA